MSFQLSAAGLTDVGRRRERNEDRFAIVEDLKLFLVTDGMGGHRCGATASRLAEETLIEFIRHSNAPDFDWPHCKDPRLSLLENRLAAAVRAANRKVYDEGRESRECRGMGSTVVAALFDADTELLIVGHVGDSRAYRVRERQITRLTRDHSLANEMNPSAGSGWFDSKASTLTRVLGSQQGTLVDLRQESVKSGDLLLLCSDGLTSLLEDQQILELLLGADDLQQACAALVAQANESGGHDNTTVVVVQVSGPASA